MKNLYSLKSALLGAVLSFGSLTAFGQTKTITITNTSIGGTQVLGSNTYANGAERKWTTDEVNFGGKAITSNNKNTPTGAEANTNIQAQSNNGVIYNTTALPA
ncbi:hypothetical protein [Chryseobacterium sp. T1]